MSEDVRPVPFAPGYFVSSDGYVYSQKCGNWRRLIPWLTNGHPVIGFRVGGRTINMYVSRVALTVFGGQVPMPGCKVRHIDGNPANNASDNLAWSNVRPKRIAQTRWLPFEADGTRVRRVGSLPECAVSVDGHVYRVRSGEARKLKPCSSSNGYLRVSVGVRGYYVHRLVAEAFHGPRPGPGYEVCHKDGTRDNNRADNLYWGTRADNMQDAVRHGRTRHQMYPERTARGTAVFGARLNDDAVRKIRDRAAAGETTESLAAEFNVSKDTIKLAVRRRTWKHVA